MILDLTGLFAQDGVLPFQLTLDLSDLDFSGVHLFQTPISVSGQGKSSAGVVSVTATASYRLNALCDRCAKPLDLPRELNAVFTVANSLQDESNDNFVFAPDMKIDIGELIREELVLSVPSKILCSEACKGICPKCGKNLNDGDCNCQKESVDPRLEALKNFLN